MTKRLCAVQQLVLAVGLAGGVAPALFAQTGRMPAYVVPSYEDFRITTRMSHGDGPSHTTTTTLYLRGARERRESAVEQTGESATPLLASILQCDQRRAIHLNLSDQLFSEVTFVEWSNSFAGVSTRPEAQGPVVTTIEDAVDTGERRRLGRHVARRVKTTTVVSPAPGANTPASRRETEGWYIDLPGLGCVASEMKSSLRLSAENPNGPRDRHRYQTKGTARRGYAIEETTRHTEARMTYTTTVTLVDWSDAPLDPLLFELPAHFRPALPMPGGGVDLTKPDSVANRLQTYWDVITAVVSRVVPWSRDRLR
ncbi:hypothetical protein [Luteitalea sp.]|uniref:hypothetical protein n=1 Tax=Luteitalea sp. TaxID=2004800 RepID=UPI0025C336A1|nr:hypothetical protein [Luteitalea sp.]